MTAGWQGDDRVALAAAWVLRFSGDRHARDEARGLLSGGLPPGQADAARERLRPLAHRLDVLTTAVRSLAA